MVVEFDDVTSKLGLCILGRILSNKASLNSIFDPNFGLTFYKLISWNHVRRLALELRIRMKIIFVN